ncbi:DNA adenine methylase [Chryseobacterium candidae]|uniref:DNA methyltransferase n=1 Tax=Chryseobacterium candidae TaxID=1978493 RepID=A0ABY2R2Y4_9FLAO|nr:DNA adenine methylase [Chryseobacterium candidae]THV56358.1 DNA methyltransferase [Chryseobacterium candidae]
MSKNTKVKNSDNQEVFRPIHYLGSKLRILDFIEDTINNIDLERGRVCDLFSGSGSVSFKLSRTRPVTSVDIQEYSTIICSALLNPIKMDQKFIDEFLQKSLNSKHSIGLINSLESLISYEKECISNALNHKKVEKLCEILEDGSLISFEILKKDNLNSKLSKLLRSTLTEFKKKKILDYQTLAIRYFGGIYFSYEQALQIDILLEQIEDSPKKYKNMLLAALISTASDCVNTVGKQFAQPIRPRKANGDIKPSLGKSVNKDRSLNVFDVFGKWVQKYNSITDKDFKNDILKMDFSIALDNLTNDTTVVYADPPYTREHYSRFYHVLETLALRDTPKISTMVLGGETLLSRGLYREDRHQSPFCIRSTAPEAFELMFSKISSKGVKLVLSYSPYDESKGSHPRVITMNKLINIANKYYSNVEVLSPGTFVHSKLTNSEKHLEASEFAEVLIVCT